MSGPVFPSLDSDAGDIRSGSTNGSGGDAHPGAHVHRTHGDLDVLAGTWTDADLREFLEATAPFAQVDEASWGVAPLR